MPDNPRLISTTRPITSHRLVRTPVTIKAYGPKYKQNIKIVLITICRLACRLISLVLKYSLIRALSVARNSFRVGENLMVLASVMNFENVMKLFKKKYAKVMWFKLR